MPHVPIAHQLFAANRPRVGLPSVTGRNRPFGVDTKKGICDVPDSLCSSPGTVALQTGRAKRTEKVTRSRTLR